MISDIGLQKTAVDAELSFYTLGDILIACALAGSWTAII